MLAYGGDCILECPRRGSHINPLTGIVDKVAAAMATTRAPLPVMSGTRAGNGA